MTTVGYATIDPQWAATLDPQRVVAALEVAGYARIRDDWAGSPWLRMVRADGREVTTIPTDREAPHYGQRMAEALTEVRNVVALGEMVAAALGLLGVDVQPRVTSHFAFAADSTASPTVRERSDDEPNQRPALPRLPGLSRGAVRP